MEARSVARHDRSRTGLSVRLPSAATVPSHSMDMRKPIKVVDYTQPTPLQIETSQPIFAVAPEVVQTAVVGSRFSMMPWADVPLRNYLATRNWRALSLQAVICLVVSVGIGISDLATLDKMCIIYGVFSLAFMIDVRISAMLGIVGLVGAGASSAVVSQELNTEIVEAAYYMLAFSLAGISVSLVRQG